MLSLREQPGNGKAQLPFRGTVRPYDVVIGADHEVEAMTAAGTDPAQREQILGIDGVGEIMADAVIAFIRDQSH